MIGCEVTIVSWMYGSEAVAALDRPLFHYALRTFQRKGWL